MLRRKKKISSTNLSALHSLDRRSLHSNSPSSLSQKNLKINNLGAEEFPYQKRVSHFFFFSNAPSLAPLLNKEVSWMDRYHTFCSLTGKEEEIKKNTLPEEESFIQTRERYETQKKKSSSFEVEGFSARYIHM